MLLQIDLTLPHFLLAKGECKRTVSQTMDGQRHSMQIAFSSVKRSAYPPVRAPNQHKRPAERSKTKSFAYLTHTPMKATSMPSSQDFRYRFSTSAATIGDCSRPALQEADTCGYFAEAQDSGIRERCEKAVSGAAKAYNQDLRAEKLASRQFGGRRMSAGRALHSRELGTAREVANGV